MMESMWYKTMLRSTSSTQVEKLSQWRSGYHQVQMMQKNDLREARPGDFRRLRDLYHEWEDRVRKNRRGRPEGD